MSATPQNADDSDPLIGHLIGGRYRILGVIGVGGMGVVYDALHEELERSVALKVLGAAWASDEEAIQRFQREARTSSNIGHPHIIDVYDLGRLDDGRPYLAMERLVGLSLADLLEDEEGLPPERVGPWIRQVASALDAVHSRGIIHRDIKPENLIIQHDESGAEVIKLLDFGLAAFAIPSEEHQRLTRAGQIHGTPHYMAPESAGEEQLDRRADVYSLAVVAYELLCGVLPFDSPNPLHILTEKMRHEPPTMSERCGVPFPDELEGVLAVGLAREPERRYATTGDFARDLENVLVNVAGQLPTGSAASAAAHSGSRGELGASGIRPPESPSSTGQSGDADAAEAPLPVRRFPWLAVTVAVLGAGAAVYIYSLPLAGNGRPEERSREGEVAASTARPADESGMASAEQTREPLAARPEPTDPGEHADPPAEPTPSAPGSDETASAESAGGEATQGAKGSETRRRPVPPRAEQSAARPTEAPQPPSETAIRDGTRAEPDVPPPALAEENRARAAKLSRNGTKALVQGRLPEAIRLFRDATNAFPRHAPAWRGLGLANERLGRGPEALRAYRRYLKLAPNAPAARSVRERISALEGG